MSEGVDENGKPYKKIKIRTILSCRCKIGVCAKCYGANMATGEPVQVGESVVSSRLSPSENRYTADHAYLPYRRCGRRRYHTGSSPCGGAV